MPRRTSTIPTLLGVAAALGLFTGCQDSPPLSPAAPSLDRLGRVEEGVTVPVRIDWNRGSFVGMPFGDPRIPEGTPTDDCPVGEANMALGIPAGFPNGGGVIVSHGDGYGRHLGHFTVRDTRCAVQFFPPTDPPFVNFDARITLTAADGDKIFVRVGYTPTPFTPEGIEGPAAEIVGGTGRFEGATGTLHSGELFSVTCTDEGPFCLEGTWSGGYVEGEITIPRP